MATEKSQWKALKDCFPHPGNGCVDKNACTHAHLGVSLWGTASGPDYCLFPSRQHPRWGLGAGGWYGGKDTEHYFSFLCLENACPLC